MDPLSSQPPPYSQYNVELYALQKAHCRIVEIPVDTQLPNPFQVVSAKESQGAKARKKKEQTKQNSKNLKDKKSKEGNEKR